jgi:hypothetical protein
MTVVLKRQRERERERREVRHNPVAARFYLGKGEKSHTDFLVCVDISVTMPYLVMETNFFASVLGNLF